MTARVLELEPGALNRQRGEDPLVQVLRAAPGTAPAQPDLARRHPRRLPASISLSTAPPTAPLSTTPVRPPAPSTAPRRLARAAPPTAPTGGDQQCHDRSRIRQSAAPTLPRRARPRRARRPRLLPEPPPRPPRRASPSAAARVPSTRPMSAEARRGHHEAARLLPRSRARRAPRPRPGGIAARRDGTEARTHARRGVREGRGRVRLVRGEGRGVST